MCGLEQLNITGGNGDRDGGRHRVLNCKIIFNFNFNVFIFKLAFFYPPFVLSFSISFLPITPFLFFFPMSTHLSTFHPLLSSSFSFSVNTLWLDLYATLDLITLEPPMICTNVYFIDRNPYYR